MLMSAAIKVAKTNENAYNILNRYVFAVKAVTSEK